MADVVFEARCVQSAINFTSGGKFIEHFIREKCSIKHQFGWAIVNIPPSL